ncbi:hypothetical protein, variant [Verruconis gallopava]|uniref:Elongation of fatty acids protein n=1 Tax=Verruconis gallopava TaxID=253628 RepID=A0A0D1YW67_9PEZI|nr:hypothetical protein, variant [Verruconis gallopava]KIW04927.1 hypothetical protein, variant [Verruconis gallopava]
MAPSIQFRMPPGWFFKFPPDEQPLALPPPTESRTFAAPFAIPSHIYTGALDHRVPITIAALYATTVIAWNRINRSRGFKPYGFSQTASFKTFVIAHNVFLAVFSAFTFFGMLRALAHTWPGREHHLFGKFWPGLRTSNGLAGAADALCHLHGPRGFGSYVAFSPDASTWVAKDSLVSLSAAGLPNDSDVGRLWNEGLAFWGWWFYLSKFYEVFDTFIILAKGKRSSTLQTYHHTGAMMCMWAGIRYMSPPIWMFCFLNSGIHTMMYIYYTLSALSIKVPQRIKRTLTTCQILQFLIGITFAGMHLFVTYDVPLSKAGAVSKTLSAAASSVASGVSAAAASVTASSGVAGWLKQAALRAAGEEGLAENVVRPPVDVSPSAAVAKRSSSASTTWETVPCIDTSGQAFAIWLNLLYLAPLTGLFVRFFVKSYTRRGMASRNQPSKGQTVKAIQDAAKGTGREVESLGKAAEAGAEDMSKKMVNGKSKASGKVNGSANGTPRSQRKVSDSINKAWERFEKGDEESPVTTPDAKSKKLRKKPSEGHSKLRSLFEDPSVAEKSKSPSMERGRSPSDAESVTSIVLDQPLAEEKAEEKTEEKTQKSETSEMRTEENAEEASISSAETHGGNEELKPASEPPELDRSFADVVKDVHPKPEGEEHSEEAQEQEQQSGDVLEQSSTPTATVVSHSSRSLSPQKSKLPRPTSREPQRSRSPVKKSTSSSIPRLSTNGQPECGFEYEDRGRGVYADFRFGGAPAVAAW